MNHTLHINSVLGDLELITCSINSSDIILSVYDIFSKRRVDFFIEGDDTNKNLILRSNTSIIKATSEALYRNGSEIFEPIIVSSFDNDYRILDFYQLLVAQNKIQLL